MNGAGLKALRKTTQLCKRARQALNLVLLHVECRARACLQHAAVQRSTKASKALSFHLEMALSKGERSDLPFWQGLVGQVKTYLEMSECLASHAAPAHEMQAQDLLRASSIPSALAASLTQAPKFHPLFSVDSCGHTGSAATSQQPPASGQQPSATTASAAATFPVLAGHNIKEILSGERECMETYPVPASTGHPLHI